MNLKKRTMDEMISHFNRTVSAMDISRKDKMTLLGMITAIGFEYQQAADVVPVRHGYWRYYDTTRGGIKLYVCSLCDGDSKTENEIKRCAYCPNCGARMDGGDNG